MSQSDKAYEMALLAWVKRQQGPTYSEDREAYANCFSGTKLDSMIEKGFAEMMRGVGGVDAVELAKDPFPRQPCSCSMSDSGEHGSDCKGKWLRTLNGSGTCYVYVHTITHEVRGRQPPNFLSTEALDAERKRRNEAALGGSWHAFPSCHLEEWRDTISRITSQEHKTPLLIVDEPETYVELLSKISQPDGAELVDTRPFVLPVSRTGVKFQDAFAAMVTRIGNALKAGRPIVLDVQDSSPHWLDKLCNVPRYRDKFPEHVFNPKALAWQKDYTPCPQPGFAVVVLTTLSPKDYEVELKDKLPWQMMRAVRVTSFIPAEYIYLADITRALDASRDRCRVPLLLDTTPERSVDTFLAYQRTQQVDVPQLLSSARTTEEMSEVLRSKLVSCMKAGDTLLLRLKDSCPDLLNKYCSDDSFPAAAFSYGEVQRQDLMQRLFREEEKEHGVCVCREGFRLVLTSWRPVVSFANDIKKSLPLHRLAVFAVELEDHE